MSKMILNEKKYVEDIINNEIKEKDLDVSKSQLIHLLSRYFYNENMDINKLYRMVSEQMKIFNFKDYYESNWYNAIMKACNITIKYKIKIKDNEFIPLYQSELEQIKKCPTDKHKKLLFTIYIISRYKNKNGRIDKQIMKKEIFDCANINGTKKDKAILINDLWKNGFIDQNFINNDTSISIKLSNGNESEILKVTSFKNLGNQILSYIKNDYKMCSRCGKLIKIKNKFSPVKYCKECSEKNTKENKKEWDKENR